MIDTHKWYKILVGAGWSPGQAEAMIMVRTTFPSNEYADSIDTHRWYKILVDAEWIPEQAEAIVKVCLMFLSANHLPKKDLKAELKAIEKRYLIKLTAIFIVGYGILYALHKFT